MLSTDQNPPVLDLSSSCPCEISQLKSSRRDNNNNIIICSLDVDDEKGCDGKQRSHQLVEVVDLLGNKSSAGFDDKNNLLPSFSIRDYVFSKRHKDINTNWPFSQRTLQLCLEHNVKDVLPPFQSPDFVKNPSLTKSVEEIINIYNAKHNVGQKSSLNTENTDSSDSGKDKIFPSATTSQPCSNVYPSLPVKTTFFEAENLPGISIEKPESSIPVVKSDIQKPVKKCRLIVKLSNISKPKPDEDLSLNATLNNSGVTEIMASKVCPVCKTFTSSSNTTLNAHIDQCLSEESTVKGVENSKLIKHRIKPRKTRLMVDIYETALPCTLEDLDRRNGTNWALNLGVTSQDSELCGEEKNKKYSCGNFENKSEKKNEESAVYIDSNGTKLRILSKFNDPWTSSTAKDDNGPMNKKDKGSEFLSYKKKKYIVNKHKVSKCPPEVDNSEKREFSTKENYKEGMAQPIRTYDQTTSADSGMIKQWVVSKRTGPRKKMNLEHEKQHPAKTMKIVGVKTNIVSLDKFMNRTDTNSSILCDETPRLRKRKDGLSCKSHDEHKKYHCPRNFLLAQNFQDNKIQRKLGPLVRERCTYPQKDIENHLSTQSSKKVCKNTSSDGPVINSRMLHVFSSGVEEFASVKKSSLDHEMSSRGKMFSSLRKKKKNLLSVNHASIPKSEKKLGRKFVDFKKTRMHYTLRSGEEAVDSRLDNLVQTPRMEKGLGESLISMSCALSLRKREQFMSQREEDMASKGSDTCESDSYDSGTHVHANVISSSSNTIKKAEIPDKLEQTSRIADGDAFITFSKSFRSSSFPTAANPCSENCPPELNLRGEQEIYSVGKDGIFLVAHHTDLVAEMDADDGNKNYVDDVDPIPIPGPPGSFLPSPGRMCSEELPGSSSLTTCKIQSSEDEHDIVDMHSSDSPTSASMVSNFVAARSDSVSFVNFSRQSHFVQRDIAEIRIDPSVESPQSFNQERRAEGKPNLDELASASRLKNDQPCCSRKEGFLQTGPSSYQESLLLRHRTMSSLPVPVHENEEESTRESEKNVEHSPMGYISARVSLNSEGSFPSYGDCESLSPSSPNPVLRLMGKNLMVVNKDENLKSSPVDNGGNNHTFHHTLSRAPPVFETVQREIPAQHFDLRSLHGFKVPTVSRTVQLASHPTAVMFSSNEHANGECNFKPDQLRPQDSLGRSGVEKFQTPASQLRPGNYSCRKRDDIIVTDDSPENVPCLVHKSAHTDVSMGPGGSAGQIAWDYDSRRLNPVYGYPLCSGSRSQNANSQVLHSNGNNANIAEWVYTPESSSVLHPNPLTTSSPFTGHLRSPMYFSPRFM